MARKRITVAVIGEGITEKYYIQSLQDILDVKPTPIKPKNSNLKELDISIKECIKKGYSKVFCLIDKDNKISDGDPDHHRNAKEYVQLKRQYHNRSHKCPDGSMSQIIMIESYPATEIFFLYYFGYTSAHYTNQQLKQILNKKFGYLTEERYLIKHSLHDLLVECGGSLETAIKASEQSILNINKDMNTPFSEIGIMIRDLLIKNHRTKLF